MELLDAGVDLAGAFGAGLAEADVDVDLDSVSFVAGCCFAAAVPRFDPFTTGASDSSDEYDSYSSIVFVTVYPRSSLLRTFLLPILRFLRTRRLAAAGALAVPFIVSVTLESAISTSGSRSLP